MAKAMAATTGEGGALDNVKGWPQRIKSFYTEVRTEMKKVTSPGRKEVQATTAVVIVTVFAFGLYFWIIDTVIGRSVSAILNHFTHR